MNRLIFWLTLFVSAVFFGSCIRDEGFAFDSPSDLQTARTEFVDTFSVSMETFRMDSLISSGREFVLAGTYVENLLGKISAEGYFQFLPESYPKVCPDSILDEYTRATLILNYGTPYGVFGINQFGLHKLTENLDGDRSHYSNEPAPSFDSLPYLNTINATRTDKHIRVDASQLGKEIIAFWKEKKTLTDDQQFLERFKGFAIKSLDSSVPQVTRFDLQYRDDAAPAFLQVYYRVKRGNEVPEEKILRFRTDRSTVQYYSFRPDYSGTKLVNIPTNGGGLPASSLDGIAVVQGGGGLSAKLRFPGLLAWKLALNKKVKVFKAELEIMPQPFSLPPPDFLRISSREDYENPDESSLFQSVLNESQVLSLLQQGYPSRETAGQALASRLFAYDASRNTYRCNITGHIQDILDGIKTSTSLNLYSSEWTISVNRMVLNPGSVKLRLYYFPF